MKVAIYARVSTRDKDQNPEVQLEPLRKFCSAMSWEIFKEYSDNASADDEIGRISWKTLFEDARLHKFDLLLIWKLDRGWRSLIRAKNDLEILTAYHIGFRSLMDAIIDTTSPNAKLILGILLCFSEFEKDNLIQRVNAGIAYAKAHGTKSGIPIGKPRHNIELVNICKALVSAKGNQSEAARILTREFKVNLKAGFVSLRLKRAGVSKEEVLQNPGLFLTEKQEKKVKAK